MVLKKEILKHRNSGKIIIPIPDVTQHSNFSCGAAVLHSVCCYWGVGLNHELDYWDLLETESTYGTLPQKIISFAERQNLNVKIDHNMTIKMLKDYIICGKPVIMPIQAHGNHKRYGENLSGHYVVAIGFDNKNIFFEDPMIRNFRGHLGNRELLLRWHDRAGDGIEYIRSGIIIWNKNAPAYLNTSKLIP
jgi:predicted double-glycine peptidase